MFTHLDADGDGQLSLEELPPRMRPNFERLDQDKDGFISSKEHLAFASRQQTPTSRPAVGPRAAPAGVKALLDLPYTGTENPRQRLDLYLPEMHQREKPLPVIVFIHGGGWRAGDKNGGITHVGRFVASGQYAGVSVGYRLSDEVQWPAQIHDCKAAIRWIKAHAVEHGLDAGKIAVWGSSAGGHLVSMLGTSGDVKELEGSLGAHLKENSQVTCVVNFYGPQNFLTMIRQPSNIDRVKSSNYPEALMLGGPVPSREAIAKEASPVTHVSAGDPPFFTAHGTLDKVVPFAQGEEIHAALKKAGVPSILQQMTDAGHGFRDPVLDKRLAQFLDVHLRGIQTDIETNPILIRAK